MIDFLIEGGILFTGPMTVLFVANLFLIGRAGFFLFMPNLRITDSLKSSIDSIKSIGILLVGIGVLGQIIGLYSAFDAIESQAIKVTPALLAGGLRVSSITTILGLSYFVLSFGAWTILSKRLKKVA